MQVLISSHHGVSPPVYERGGSGKDSVMYEFPRTLKPVERVAAGPSGCLQPGSKDPLSGLMTHNTGSSVGAHRFRFLMSPRKTAQCPGGGAGLSTCTGADRVVGLRERHWCEYSGVFQRYPALAQGAPRTGGG